MPCSRSTPATDPLVIGAGGTNTLDFSTAAQSVTINLGLDSGQTQLVDSAGDELTLEAKINEFIGLAQGRQSHT